MLWLFHKSLGKTQEWQWYLDDGDDEQYNHQSWQCSRMKCTCQIMMQYMIIMMKGRIVIISNVVTNASITIRSCTNSCCVWKSKHLPRGCPPSRWRFHSWARPLARFKCQPSYRYSVMKACCKSLKDWNISLHCYVFLGHSSLVLLERHAIHHQFLTKSCLVIKVLWDISLLKLICLKVEVKWSLNMWLWALKTVKQSFNLKVSVNKWPCFWVWIANLWKPHTIYI